VARPTSKETLLEAADSEFEKLWGLVNAMTPDERQSSFDFGGDAGRREDHWGRDKCLRDVLVHLHEWHKLMLVWVEANRRGESRPFFPEPYTWKTYGTLNVELWRKHQSTPLEEAERLVRSSHDSLLSLVQQFSSEELFEKQYFPWTGTTSLGAYCVSATSSHYDWALKKLRAHLKILRAQRTVS